ncbi:MAG TPA: carbamoyltransferase [Flavilitoribacter sp.]|nr:carbamoyltransferase [Flavilitoribacter sp.]HMQ89942.1 carbamoyltransferase [Flavilitoribacter sp.]
MKILGISAYYHDAAAAVIENGEILAAAQEEWFSRKKHDPSFPAAAAGWCLDYAGFAVEELDAVVFYDKPFLKFERLLETYYGFAPRGLESFVRSMPIWIKEKLFLKDQVKRELKALQPGIKHFPKLLFPEHHLSHAASAFYPSPFEEAAILTVDGVGEWATASICHGKGHRIEILKELRFPHSLGLLYSAFTYFLGFRVNSGEYKLMGLAPYGDPDAGETKTFLDKIKTTLVDIMPDGSIWLNQDWFRYAVGLRMIRDQKWAQLFGMTRRAPDAPLDQRHCNLASAIQQVTEEVVLKMARTARQLTGSPNICLAGGVALNCVANGKLEKSGLFEQIWIQPAAGDAGGALGAALAAQHIYFDRPRPVSSGQDQMKGAFIGPEFSDLDIELTARKYKAPWRRFESVSDLVEQAAAVLSVGNVVGWFQGRQEFGPRALGARSILGDARNPEMQRKLNLKIKFRESFRPFAPSVLIEDAPLFFDLNRESPYMLLVAPVMKDRRNDLSELYGGLPLMEKLDTLRSDIPAVTHVDFSARVQTVHKETNPVYYDLLSAFKQLTGYGLLVNTSFNVRGEPVVCTPDDAFRCFIRTDMDFLVMGNYLFDKMEISDNRQVSAAKAESFGSD